jgi:hypothetical protein
MVIAYQEICVVPTGLVVAVSRPASDVVRGIIDLAQ